MTKSNGSEPPFYPWVCECGGFGLTIKPKGKQCGRCEMKKRVRIRPWDGWIEAAKRRAFVKDSRELEKMMETARLDWSKRA